MKKLALVLGLFAFLLFIGTVSATTYECDSCSDCYNKINAISSSGDTIQLNKSITAPPSAGCIKFNATGGGGGGADNKTFDCLGHTIDGNGSSYYGFTMEQNTMNDTIQNCIIKDMTSWGILDSGSNLDQFINITIQGCQKGFQMTYTGNATIRDSRIENSGSWGWRTTFTNNLSLYNNIFNESTYIEKVFDYDYPNYYNTTRRTATNIIGGSEIGGNYWAYPNGTGYSQTCDNADNDSFCDAPFVLNENNTDYLPLTTNWTFAPPSLNISFVSPTPTNNTIKSSGSFIANISSNGTISSCIITLDGGNSSMTIASGNLSASKANSGLSNGKHIYNVTCDGFNSETRTVWVSFGNCTSCSECTEMATNSDTGVTINIVNNISSGGSCISGIKDSQTVDGRGNTISCSSGTAITVGATGYVTIANTVFNGCGVSIGGYGVAVHHFKFINNTLTNAGSTFDNRVALQYPIVEFWNISYNSFNNSNIWITNDNIAGVLVYDTIGYNRFLDSTLQLQNLRFFSQNNAGYGIHHNIFLSSSNGTGYGVQCITGCSWIPIYSNIFMGKQYAIYNTELTDGWYVWDNKFLNNTQIIVNATNEYGGKWLMNRTKNCNQTSIIGGCVGGNYYDTYFGADTNGDGIGETQLPYLYNALGATLPNPDWLPLTNTTLPTITITSPEPIQYIFDSAPYIINLNVTADRAINTWFYSLNGGSNNSFSPNTTITAISGSNTITVWGNDTNGNFNFDTIVFTARTKPLIDNIGLFGGIALLVMGAGIILFLLEGLFGAGALLRNPKGIMLVIIGAIIMAAMILALL